MFHCVFVNQIIGIVHKWVDQFALEPMSLFIQNFGQILEIITSLH
jgi:hypothetical protein